MNNQSEHLNMINVGIIGYGFMGQTHAKAYQLAHSDDYPCRLFAIADSGIQDVQNVPKAGNIEIEQHDVDLDSVLLFESANDILKNPEVDLVSICTHTDSHVNLAIEALKAGKHVVVEKPIAIDTKDVQRLADAAKASDLLCVPAMCMRHWPAWIKIHEIVRSNEHGNIRSAEFHRLGSQPTWSTKFYKDITRSGGVLRDLHIHDTDFIVHCFGVPDAVTTVGDPLHLTTLFKYPSNSDYPIHVSAQAAWDHQPAIGFQMRCTIVFDNATLDFDINRDQQLVLHQGDDSTVIEVGTLSGYDGEVRWAIEQIRDGNKKGSTYIDEAVQVSRVLDAEQKSMSVGRQVQIRL
ncbi:MAG: Gfo/Idh/MocA family oxidoreductase [Phycisphaerales bacterium]|nr:Gfo/Idh/MocA family oxidoreductase [Phycisphaerales bacterium]